MSVVRRLDEAAQAIPLRARSLTDLQLKALKPRDKAYKVSDRDGLYAYVAPSGTVSLRYDYRIGRRRETLTLGRYDATAPARVPRSLDVLEYGMGLSLAEARLLLTKAKRALEQGVSPSRAKAEQKAAESEHIQEQRLLVQQATLLELVRCVEDLRGVGKVRVESAHLGFARESSGDG